MKNKQFEGEVAFKCIWVRCYPCELTARRSRRLILPPPMPNLQHLFLIRRDPKPATISLHLHFPRTLCRRILRSLLSDFLKVNRSTHEQGDEKKKKEYIAQPGAGSGKTRAKRKLFRRLHPTPHSSHCDEV